MTASRTSWLKRLVNMWVAAAVVFLVSIGGTAARPKSADTAAHPKKILILHTFGPNFQQGAAWSREIQEELNRQSPWPLNIQEQSLVTALDGNDAAEAKFVEYLGALYTQHPPDLIVALGGLRLASSSNTGQTCIRHRRCCSRQSKYVGLIHPCCPRRTPWLGRGTIKSRLVENIMRLLPETKTIAIIIGNSPPERFWAGEHQRILGPLLQKQNVELIFYGEQPLADILKAVASLPPHTAIFYQQLSVDGAGAVYGDKEPLKRIYEVANAPIFSFDQTYFNGEVVGGPMFSPAEGARAMAAVGVRVLGGEKADGIKVPPIGFSAPKYDWRLLQRWNISESRLPPGSEILFREPTVWERYSWQIASIVAVLLIQAGLIAIMLQEHRRRQFAEVQSRQRMTELAHVNRFATAGELTASIAHEINQPLGSILTNAETAEAILKSQAPTSLNYPTSLNSRKS